MRIFKSNLTKKLLGVVLILGLSGIFLNGYVGIGETVHAQENETATQTEGIDPINETSSGGINTMSLWQILNLLLKIIYIFLWPLLVVAGLALDNTLVYASIFHMDAPLWKFWNMMKNFANYALGFMVLFAIIKSILTNGGEGSLKDEKSPLGIIKKTLIAGILIQASWFLMAVLIDVSTIATYAVGGLPLNILKNDDIGKMQIITVNSTINLDKFDIISAGGQGFDVWYTLKYKDKEMKVSPCRIEDSFVIGRVKGGPDYKNSEKFNGIPAYEGNELCVLYGNKIVMRQEEAFMQAIGSNNPTSSSPDFETKAGYDGMLKILLKDITGRQDQSWVQQYAVKLGGSSTGEIKGQTFLDDKDTVTMQLSQLIDKSKGFVGPLVTIYSSLLNFAQLTDTDITSVGETSGVFIIKTGVALALFFPLLALAVVLIARIGLLWLFIVASPFIILKESFSLKLGKLDEYLSIKGVMGIVFAPVVSVAALSLSLIFLTALLNGFSSSNPNDSVRFEEAFSVEKIQPINTGNDAINFQGAAQIEFSKLPRGDALDRFSWLLVNFFAIGLMWMVVFAAIKANKIGEGVGKKIQDFGGNMFQTLPIIPLPNGEKAGIGSIGKVLYSAPDRKIQDMVTADNNRVRSWLYGDDDKAATPLTKAEATDIFNNTTTPTSIVTDFQARGVKKEDIGTAINSSLGPISEALAVIEPGQRAAVIAAIVSTSEETGIEQTLNAEITKVETKKALDDISRGLADEAAVKSKFVNPTTDDARVIEAYFNTGASDYTVTTTPENKTYTITKDTANPGSYIVTPEST